MLTDKFLDEWVSKIVPEEYGPNKIRESDKPLLGVYLVSTETLEKSKEIYKFPEDKNLKIYGQLVDMGDLMRRAKRDGSKLDGKYIIRVCESQSLASGIFTMAHEVGHLKGILEDYTEHEADEDAYADAYAFSRVKEVIEDSDLRIRVILQSAVKDNSC